MTARVFTVSQLARVAKVTVRALHHYDEIGLLVPSERSPAGYRLYARAEVERLQQIRLYRELGFPLEAIRALLDQPAADRGQALREQRALLRQRLADTHALIRAVDDVLGTLEGGRTMDDPDKMFDPYEEEARERWGDTEAYKESARRTKGYSAEDWGRMGAESGAVLARAVELMEQGVAPDSAEAMAMAEEHRRHLDRWFYPCSHEMHVCLGEGYVSDPRFTAFYERVKAGLTAFLAAAIVANARLPR